MAAYLSSSSSGQLAQYADAVDGTPIAHGPDENLPELERWLNAVSAQAALL